MKRIFLSALLFVLFSGMAQTVFAQAKGFGLGIILGEPTGVSIKKWTGEHGAFDGAVAWSFTGSGYLHLHADYLRHSFKLIDVNQGQLPVYYGLGVKLVMANDPILGARIPLGINYIFGDAPLDLFAEIVPGLNLINNSDNMFFIEGGLGIRFWIK